MNASDITRQVLAQATLTGFNTILMKGGQPKSDYDLSGGCAGFFDVSSCAFLPNPRTNAPSLIKYPTYAFRQLVQEGLVDTNVITSNVLTMTKQAPAIYPDVVFIYPPS
jgi:hypothetical protein